MRLNFKFERDGNYYFGLALLVLASASIVWAFFFDGFEPKDFLAYFLIYAWGFTLLLKSDSEYRLNRLEETVTDLQNRLDRIEADFNLEADVQHEEREEAEWIARQDGTESALTKENMTERPAEHSEEEA